MLDYSWTFRLRSAADRSKSFADRYLHGHLLHQQWFTLWAFHLIWNKHLVHPSQISLAPGVPEQISKHNVCIHTWKDQQTTLKWQYCGIQSCILDHLRPLPWEPRCTKLRCCRCWWRVTPHGPLVRPGVPEVCRMLKALWCHFALGIFLRGPRQVSPLGLCTSMEGTVVVVGKQLW